MSEASLAAEIERGYKLRRRATAASVAAAALLIAVKLVAWLASGSVSVLSSLVDSLLDILASVLNFLAVRQALVPADREHRFGHGKAEPLAGLGQAAFISGSSVLLLIEAIRRILDPVPLAHSGLGIAVMLFSIAVTLVLVRYQRHVVAATGSLAISADELHYRSDIAVNGGVILALLIVGFTGWRLVDPLFGIAIAGWIVWSAWQILGQSLTQLMDRELPDEDRARIRRLAEAHPEVRAVHDLRTRAAGPTAFIQLHLEMDGAMTLTHAHEVSDAVETTIREAFPGAEVIIHQDPEGVAEPRLAFPPKSTASG